MTIIYRMIITNPNGFSFIENYDIDVLKQMRATANETKETWPIRALDIKFHITNDPDSRQFDDIDLAQEICTNLAQDTFQVQFTKSMLDPQPAGLDD